MCSCDLLVAHPELLPCMGSSKVTECQTFLLMCVCLSKPIEEIAMDTLCLCVFIHCVVGLHIILKYAYCNGLQ